MSQSFVIFASFALGYLLGSIPFGLVLTKLAGTQDIRAIGSGNIGATNVLRTGRRGLAATTLACDIIKGTLAVLLALRVAGLEGAIAAGLGAFLGHLFPVWLRFKGGKGIATYIGILAGFAWPVALGFCAIWLIVAAIARYSSLSGLTASLATPLMLWWAGQSAVALLFVLLTALVFYMHRANIGRLIAGTEPRIGASSRTA